MAVDMSESRRTLTEIASGLPLDTISLGRQYLRSLLFSLECISTLFYGDIISMNPLELLAEIAITFWSIYIYGSLIGAQGERIDAQARQEAAFEQNLAELQHFLSENDVPKGLKRQVKAYYARMWRRHQGKPEFASVADVSKALYEDVVFATQRDFAAQVRVFRALDENFLRGLLVCLEYVVCSEGEEVVTKGDMDRSMYFIAQGRILVRLDSGESMRERGEFFGEFALLYGISRLETCIAISVAELYRLDHEPYERLLQDFPGYRRRNKQSWTTPAPQNHSVLRANNYAGKRKHTATTIIGAAPILACRVNVQNVDADTTVNIENEVPHTFVYKSTMEMMAQLHTMHPEEAKQLILKVRAGSRKRLSREIAQEQQDDDDDDYD
ncbi:Cyclic nucleotide-gated channel cone photoreceptor subunit alpha [Phytophthora cinnamomi]|uniref:Cyclic nucleotide-gated channel cone photoreceptor subunit alpha n=1 Tax=Phytophthora cinnamomi TaxID=4785 RepID=UPI00355969C4|nr:Cyclic nucleotide-gated channel cone photoreceptor subunit alpha [Phytophthora cinnamomi]